MNTLRIILKELKQGLRNWRVDALMVLFPILLIAILGAAFSGAFAGTAGVERVRVLYTIEDRGPLGAAFRSLAGQAAGAGIELHETSDVARGKQSVTDVTYAAYVLVANDRIVLYRNERYLAGAGVVQSLLTAFLLRYNAAAAAQSGAQSGARPDAASPQPAVRPAAAAPPAVEVTSLDGSRGPSSFDYFSVTMLTLIIMYGSMTGMWSVHREFRWGTGRRILSAPVSRSALLWAKVIGSLAVVIVQIAVVFAFGRYLLGANWGSDYLTVFAIILAEAVMAISIGVAIAHLVRGEGPASAVINTIVPLLIFLGGGYVPLDSMGPVLSRIAALSPLKWVNTALFGVIYNHDGSAVGSALAVNFGIAALCVLVAALLSRREAV